MHDPLQKDFAPFKQFSIIKCAKFFFSFVDLKMTKVCLNLGTNGANIHF